MLAVKTFIIIQAITFIICTLTLVIIAPKEVQTVQIKSEPPQETIWFSYIQGVSKGGTILAYINFQGIGFTRFKETKIESQEEFNKYLQGKLSRERKSFIIDVFSWDLLRVE